MRALDWIGRVLVLVLSTLATLAIVASLVSVSAPIAPESGADGEAGIAAAPASPPSAVATPRQSTSDASAGVAATHGELAEERGARELSKWLPALTYAVLGLAGFVAVLVIVAMRATAHLGVLADRR